jgi:purine-binding chemotaxis protein CheW
MPGGDHGDVLLVRVAGDVQAMAAGQVVEIVRPQACTRVPNGPASLRGLTNLRGRVLPVVSLAALLGRAEDGATPAKIGAQRMVVAGAEPVGFLVDEVVSLGNGGSERVVLDLPALLAAAFAGGGQLAAVGAPPRAAVAQMDAVRRDDVALLVLEVAGQEYGLRLDQVRRVVPMPAHVTPVPGADPVMLGVMAANAASGEAGVVPLVSLPALLGLATPPLAAPMLADRTGGPRWRVAVVELGGRPVGLAAPGLDAILRVAAGSIGPVPAVLTRGRAEARLEGITQLEGGRRLVCVLSAEHLLDTATMERIMSQAGDVASAAKAAGPDSGGERQQFVVFLLGGERYGLPITAVQEVVRRPASLTRVPMAPDFVAGVMNLRGVVLPVISQAHRFGTAGPAAGGRVMVVRIGGLMAGLAVDAVTEILNLDPASLQPAPLLAANGAPGTAEVFDRVAVDAAGGLTLLIDPVALLNEAERDILAAITREDSGLARGAA